MQSNDEIVKTYLVSTDHNDPNNRSTSATFHIDFPEPFVNSINRRFITVMPPRIIYGDDKHTSVDNEYIMHCSFIYRDPFHEKSRYKTYEYKATCDGFDKLSRIIK